MAFKVLSADEVELLTENQRKWYEEELSIYKERVKFVEQMEKYENLIIGPYKPKLAVISPVKKAPKKEFKRSQVAVKRVDAFVKNAPEIVTNTIEKPVPAGIPASAKIKNVAVSYQRVPEKSKINLPKAEATVPIIKPYTAQNQAKAAIPLKAKTVIPNNMPKIVSKVSVRALPKAVEIKDTTKVRYTPVLLSESIIRNDISNSSLSDKMTSLSFSAYIQKQPVLPTVTVEIPKTQGYTAHTQPKAVLTMPVKPQKIEFTYKTENNAEVHLPRALIISPLSIMFKKAAIQAPKLFVAQKVKIPDKGVTKVDCLAVISNTPFRPNIKRMSYIKPQNKVQAVPKLSKLTAVPKLNSKAIVKNTIEINRSPIKVAAVKEYKRVTGKVKEYPQLSSVNVPSIYGNELIRKLLS